MTHTTEPVDGLVTLLQAEELLDVPSATIRKWKQRGDVVQADAIPARGRTGETPLFRLDELEPLAVRYHQRDRRGLAELIENTAARPIGPCPVCGGPVQTVLTRVDAGTGVLTPCMHAAIVDVGPRRVRLTRWAPRRV